MAAPPSASCPRRPRTTSACTPTITRYGSIPTTPSTSCWAVTAGCTRPGTAAPPTTRSPTSRSRSSTTSGSPCGSRIFSTAGFATRRDAEPGHILDTPPAPPPGEPEYRWEWNSPTLVSRHDPSVVYAGGNRLFISRDRGGGRERHDDLTRRLDRDTLRLMGVRGADITLSRHDGESSFGVISAIAESPLDRAILWVGADDGNVQVSRDGGRTWSEVSGNIRGTPNGAFVSRVIASRSGPGAAYVTFGAH